MDERFERHLRVGLADLLDTAEGEYPVWAASPAAERVAGDRSMPWPIPRLSRPALLRVGLVAAVVVAAGIAMSLLIRPAVIFGPAAPVASPAPPASPGASAGANVLATTAARSAPVAATCPPGTDPDIRGDPSQARPEALSLTVAFDRRAGRVVAVADGSTDGDTWTFDVCTNTWGRVGAAGPSRAAWLVYDVDSDLTVAAVWPADEGAPDAPLQAWVYNLLADHWMRGADTPFAGRLLPGTDTPPGTIILPGENPWIATRLLPVFGDYDPVSGLVVFAEGGADPEPGSVSLWAYEPEADTWRPVRQQGDPDMTPTADTPAGVAAFSYDASVDRFVAIDGKAATWTFDPRRGTWRNEGRQAAVFTSLVYDWGPGSVPVFDESAGLTLYPDDRGRVAAYDAARNTWSTLADRGATSGCLDYRVAYDSVHGRMVCLDWSETPVEAEAGPATAPGVAAFDAASRQWRLLVEPHP